MKYLCVRACGIYRQGHTYDLERPLPVLAMSAIRAGYLIAAGGWSAPSEPVYSLVEPVATDGLMDLPKVTTRRGGFSHTDPVVHPEVEDKHPVKKTRKPRKKLDAPPTLESLAEQTASGLDDLRGPASV